MAAVQTKTIAGNKKAFHDYFVEESMEAGIELTGTEVKSLRQGGVNLKDAWCSIEDGEVWIKGMHISPYEKGNLFNRDPLRVRRLLLCAALGLTEDGLNLEIPYVRALAMDGAGRRVLREMRDLETLPIINAGQTPEDKDYFELELRAAGLYGLFGEGPVCAAAEQLRRERIYLK